MYFLLFLSSVLPPAPPPPQRTEALHTIVMQGTKLSKGYITSVFILFCDEVILIGN